MSRYNNSKFDLENFFYNKYNITYSNFTKFLYILIFSLIIVLITLENFYMIFNDNFVFILILIAILPFISKNYLIKTFNRNYKKSLSSGYIALIDFFSFIDTERNLFKVCEIISKSNYYLVSDVFKKSIIESQTSYNSLKEVLIKNFEKNFFGELKKYWIRTFDIWDKDPEVINTFINSLSNRIDEHFREEIKNLENQSSVYIALGSILPPSSIILLMIIGQINVVTSITLGFSLIIFALFFSPYLQSKQIFNNEIVTDNFVMQGSELAAFISEELVKGYNFRKTLLTVINSIENHSSGLIKFLSKYKSDLILGVSIDNKFCSDLGKILCETQGSIILGTTNKLIEISPKVALKFLEKYSISLIKQESYYSERKSLFTTEKIRLFTTLIFSTMTLGFCTNVAALFQFVYMIPTTKSSEIMIYDWKAVIESNSYFLEIFIVLLASLFYLYGYDDIRLKTLTCKDTIKIITPLLFFFFLFILAVTISKRIVII